MRPRGLLSRQQVEKIHYNSLRVLEEVGVKVEHGAIRNKLAAIGGIVDSGTDRVRFPRKVVENLIWNAPRDPIYDGPPKIWLTTGVYQCLYMDPRSSKLVPFDEESLAKYFGLAKSLPGMDNVGVLGLPFVPDDIPATKLPLAERLYAWKYGVNPSGSVFSTELCGAILEMYKVHAAATGKPLQEIFNVGGFIISPLRLGRPECEQVQFFYERGLRMWIGHLTSQGGTAPVTFAGTLVLNLAEQLFIFLFDHALWGDVSFSISGMASTIDMHRGTSCYGRPERQRVNLAFADIADFYGCPCWGHTGTTDAHTPSYEAGVHKAQGAIITALATGEAMIEAGLLSTDEICSPVQMVLDHDLAQNLRALFADAVVNDEECAVDEIISAGVYGNHMGTDFTAERFRSCLFEPATWSNQLVTAWLNTGMQTDTDKALDIVLDFESTFVPERHITEDEERELRDIIKGKF